MHTQGIEKYNDVFLSALDVWGTDYQVDMMGEKCLKLAKEILKRHRTHDGSCGESIRGEIADVCIMMEQMMHVYGHKDIESMVDKKILRLKMKIDDCKSNAGNHAS